MILDLITDTGAGLVYDGQDNPRADLLAAALAYLLEHGMHRVDAEDMCVDRRGLIVRAWWGGEERGLVQEHHDGAQPVTVVHVHLPEAS